MHRLVNMCAGIRSKCLLVFWHVVRGVSGAEQRLLSTSVGSFIILWIAECTESLLQKLRLVLFSGHCCN